MRSINIFALIILFLTCGWMIPQESFTQQGSWGAQLSNQISNPYELWAYSPNFGYELRPDSELNVSGNNFHYIDISSTGPMKVIPPPVEHKYTIDNKPIVVNEATIYKLNLAVDIPIVAAGTIWSVYAFTKIYSKAPPTVQEIQNLNKNDINVFDRWAVYPANDRLDKLSYYPFYAAIPLPLLFFLSNDKTRKDFYQLGLIYWEVLSVMGLTGTSSTFFVDRYRPYCYTDETPMDKRISKVAKNSFYSGHVEMVAAPSFFMAKVFSDYYPDSDIKWVFYGFAFAITATTSYMRLKAGEHFPSDILIGAVMGALTGILIPEYHRNEDPSLNVLPYSDEMSKGLTLIYRF